MGGNRVYTGGKLLGRQRIVKYQQVAEKPEEGISGSMNKSTAAWRYLIFLRKHK